MWFLSVIFLAGVCRILVPEAISRVSTEVPRRTGKQDVGRERPDEDPFMPHLGGREGGGICLLLVVLVAVT